MQLIHVCVCVMPWFSKDKTAICRSASLEQETAAAQSSKLKATIAKQFMKR